MGLALTELDSHRRHDYFRERVLSALPRSPTRVAL